MLQLSLLHEIKNIMYINVGLITSELKGLTKKLPFRIPSSVKVHSLTSFCIKMYIDMACIVMYDNISIARSKRVNEKIVLCYTVQEEDQFPCKSSGLWFTWIISYDRYGIVRTHNRLFYKK